MRLLLTILLFPGLMFAASATDNFNRADENPITSPWLVHPGSANNIQLVSNTLGGVSNGDDAVVYNTAYTATGEQYAEFEWSALGSTSDAGSGVKWTNSSSLDGYFCSSYSTTEQVAEFNSGSYNLLVGWTVSNFIVGDVVRAEYEGGQIKCTKNGGDEVTFTDSGHTGGYVGAFIYEGGVRLDNFDGGDIGGAPATRRIWNTVSAKPINIKSIFDLLSNWLVVPAYAQAGQDRYYIMDMIGTGDWGAKDPTRPAYADTHLSGYQWASMNYGAEMITLVYVQGISTPDHNALNAEPGVDSFPLNLDSTVSAGQLATVQNIMESRRIPGNWVTTGTTYREIVRKIAAAFQFFKRMRGKGFGNILDGGRTMDTTFGELPAQARQDVIDTSDELGYDRTGLDNSSTLRQVIKRMADEWGAATIVMLNDAI